MTQYLLAMDAGTGSVRAVLFTPDGTQVGVAQSEWTHNEDPRWPGSMDFDWKHNWELASNCVKKVIADTGIDAHDIAGVSTTCMREGILLYDKDGNEIWACANVDARSNDEVGELIAMNPDLGNSVAINAYAAIGISGASCSIELILPEAATKNTSLVGQARIDTNHAKLAVTAAHYNRSAFDKTGISSAFCVHLAGNLAALKHGTKDVGTQAAALGNAWVPCTGF